jgi:hypothetical protein
MYQVPGTGIMLGTSLKHKMGSKKWLSTRLGPRHAGPYRNWCGWYSRSGWRDERRWFFGRVHGHAKHSVKLALLDKLTGPWAKETARKRKSDDTKVVGEGIEPKQSWTSCFLGRGIMAVNERHSTKSELSELALLHCQNSHTGCCPSGMLVKWLRISPCLAIL